MKSFADKHKFSVICSPSNTQLPSETLAHVYVVWQRTQTAGMLDMSKLSLGILEREEKAAD